MGHWIRIRLLLGGLEWICIRFRISWRKWGSLWSWRLRRLRAIRIRGYWVIMIMMSWRSLWAWSMEHWIIRKKLNNLSANVIRSRCSRSGTMISVVNYKSEGKSWNQLAVNPILNFKVRWENVRSRLQTC